MAECVDLLTAGENSAADGALGAGSCASLGAGCLNSSHVNNSVLLHGDLFALLHSGVAPLAVGVAGVADFGAGCFLSVDGIASNVRNCGDYVRINVFFASTAVLYAQSIGRAGRLNNDFSNISCTSYMVGKNDLSLSPVNVLRSIADMLDTIRIYKNVVAYIKVIELVAKAVVVSVFILASRSNVFSLYKVMSLLRNLFASRGNCPALYAIGHAPSQNYCSMANTLASRINLRNGKGLADGESISVVRIVVLIEGENGSAEVLAALIAPNSIGLAVVLAESINIRIVALISLGLNAHVCLVLCTQVACCDHRPAFAAFGNHAAIGAVCITGLALAAAEGGISKLLGEAHRRTVVANGCFVNSYIAISQIAASRPADGFRMSGLNSALILEGLVAKIIAGVYVLISYNKSILVGVARIGCRKHGLKCSFLSGSVLLILMQQVKCSVHLTIGFVFRIANNNLRILALLADSIAPAVILAVGLHICSKAAPNMASCLCLFVAILKENAAISADGNRNTYVFAICSLKLNSLEIVAKCCALILCSLIRKRCDLKFLDNSVIGFAVSKFDASLLCSWIYSDVDGSYITICMAGNSAVCHCNSRNQRCDHENSHQHAQQSLFHFLLFTSV